MRLQQFPFALPGRQEFLEALIENIIDGLAACNLDGELVLFNQATRTFHGLLPEPIKCEDWAKHYDLHDETGKPLELEQIPLWRALQGESVRDALLMIIPKTGEARSLIANADPIYDAIGNKSGAMVLMRDVTALKASEAESRSVKSLLENQVAAHMEDLEKTIAELQQNKQQLEDSEAQFRTTFEQAAMGCGHLDISGKWLQVNQKLCDIVGYSREELLATTFQNITHPDDLAEDIAHSADILAGIIENYSLEKRYFCKDQSIVWVQITVSLRRQIQSSGVLGVSLYFIAMVENISDRKQLELQNEESRRALEKAKAALEDRNDQLDQFVYAASHDLKAPLRGITNLSEWLEEDLSGQLSEENQQQLMLLRQRAKRMENLIDGLSKYSRIGREQVNCELVDTYSFLLELVDSLAPTNGFDIQIPKTCPPIMAKRLLLGQVFSNLINNAIKHHDRDSGTVIVDWENQEQHYLFSVTDDGPGIPVAFQDRIFTVFQTLSGSSSPENTGIGLALIKKIVENEGGVLRLHSNGDRGCKFEFTWPKLS
jgi:PAS domain S-box-containing protein